VGGGGQPSKKTKKVSPRVPRADTRQSSLRTVRELKGEIGQNVQNDDKTVDGNQKVQTRCTETLAEERL